MTNHESMPSFSWFVRAIDLVTPMIVVCPLALARGMTLTDPFVMFISFAATFVLILGALMFLPEPSEAETWLEGARRLLLRMAIFVVGSGAIFMLAVS